MRSNMFANIESGFKNSSKEENILNAAESFQHIIDMSSELEDADSMIIGLAIVGARLGVAGDGVINEDEKEIINEFFGALLDNPDIDEIYEMIGTDISEEDFELVEGFVKLGNNAAMPFLGYILSFAYVDGIFEDEVAQRLDSIYGMNLLTEFFNGGIDEVPSSTIRLTGLDAHIAKWFDDDDELRTLKDIKEQFPEETEEDIEKSLDYLCDEGVLYSVDTFLGKMYGLA